MAISLIPGGFSTSSAPLRSAAGEPGNPLLGYIDGGGAVAAEEQQQPFHLAEAARIARGQAAQQEALEKLDAALLDPDGFAKGKDMGYAPGPDKVRRRLTGSYLRWLNGGLPFQSQVAQDVFRDRFAKENFDGRGLGDDLAFFGEAAKQAQGRKDDREIRANIAKNALLEATVTAGAGRGEAKPYSWPAYLQDIRKRPGYNAAREPEYHEAWQQTVKEANEVLAPLGGSLNEVFNALRGGDLDLGKYYERLQPGQHKQFLGALRLLADTLPAQEQATFWGNVFKSADRFTADTGANISDFYTAPQRGTGEKRPPLIEPGDVPGMTEEQADRVRRGEGDEKVQEHFRNEEARQRHQARKNFRRDLTEIRDENFDPVKALNPEGTWARFGEDLSYGVLPAVGYAAMAAVPYVGMQLIIADGKERIYGDLRSSMLKGGMSDARASETAEDLSSLLAVPYAAIEHVQASMVFGKFPAFEKFLNVTADRMKNSVLRAGGRVLLSAAGQTLQENVQDFLPVAAQEAAHYLSLDVPGVNWSNGRNGFLDGYWYRTAVTFGTMLPLSLASGLGGRARDVRAAAHAEASDDQLLAFGYSPDAVSDIRKAASSGLTSLDAAIEKGQATRDPNSETAREAVAKVVAQQKQAAEVAEQAEASGLFPRMVRTEKGWTLYDQESGEEIGRAVDARGALQLASQHMDLREENHADEVAYLSTLLEAGEATRKGDKAGEATAVDLRPGEAMSAERMMQRSKEDEARILAQIEAARARGEDVDLAAAVLGENLTEMRRGVREMTNRLYAGGSVLTVFHEDAHKRLRLAQAKGLLQRDDLIKLGRALDTVLAGKESKHGHKLRLLPENEAEITDQALDEMVAELLESEIIRRRKTGGAYGLPAAVLSKNLGALTRLQAGVVKSFKQFVEAFRAFFGLAVSRAYEIKKGIKAGTIQEADLDEFMARLAGTSEQEEHDAASLAQADEILGGGAFEGDPFSLQGSKVAEALRTDAFSRIKDPVRRVRAMGKIARAMDEARLQFERIELLAREKGGKRVAKSLRREAAMREAMRREELENEAWARHMAVLSDDELTKLKAQPGHAFLADPKSPLKGRLMSKSRALKKHPELFANATNANYDGSERVSRTVFGGDLTPDLAAQEMYEEGLIKEPTPHALWELLESEGKHVAQMRQFLETAKEDLREARTVAKAETNAWLQEETKNQADPEQPYSPKQEILRMLQLLDGILAALPAEIRGKLGGHTQLARLGTNKTRLEYLKGKLERADELLEEWLKREYHSEFIALLDKAKPEKDEAGKSPRGKIGADVHALFATLREAMRWTPAETESEAVRLETLVAGGELTPEQESHATLEANMIRLVGDWYSKSVPVKDPESGAITHKQEGGASAARREAALIEATNLYLAGYHAHVMEVQRKRDSRTKLRERLRLDTGKAGLAPARDRRTQSDEGTKIGRTKANKYTLISFEQLMQEAFGIRSEAAQSLADWERRASNSREDALQNKLDLLDQLFEDLAGGKYKGEQLRAKLGAPGAIEVDGRSLSELQGITVTMMWRQEDGQRHMEGHKNEQGQPVGEWHYSQAFVDKIEASLSAEAQALRLHLTEQYAAEYERVNSIYRQLYGVALPRQRLYSPLTVTPQQPKDGQIEDPVTGFAMGDGGFTPGALKTRSLTAIAEPEFRDALQVYIAHSRQMEHWMSYAPFTMDAQAVLNDRSLRNSVEERIGKQGKIAISKWLNFFAKGGVEDAQAQMEINGQINRAMSRNAQMALVGRVSVLAIQSTQLGAALAEMPTGAYLSRFAKLMTGRLGWLAAFDSPFIQRRLAVMPPLVQQALSGLRSSKPSRLKYAVRLLGRTISGADALFTAGTYAIVHDYQAGIAKGLGLTGREAADYARAAAERCTERVAQPIRPGARSIYENTLSSPYAKMIWMFSSEARQKFALSVLGHSDRTLAERARAYAVTWLVGGVIATMIRAAIRDLRDDGDDDEIFDKRNWNPVALGLSSLTGPLGGVPVVGEGMEAIAFKAAGERLPSGGLAETMGKGAEGAVKLFKHDGDVEDGLRSAEAVLNAGGLVFDGAAAWTSIFHVIRDLLGMAGNIPE